MVARRESERADTRKSRTKRDGREAHGEELLAARCEVCYETSREVDICFSLDQHEMRRTAFIVWKIAYHCVGRGVGSLLLYTYSF